MKSRPILFSAPMVRALLAGSKTQTRRIVKPQPSGVSGGVPFGNPPPYAIRDGAALGSSVIHCPYGKIKDQLWVRETWREDSPDDPEYAIYRADQSHLMPKGGKWKPSIFMPRWASRIILEITGVRIERLNEISEADAEAEGIQRVPVGKLITFTVPGTNIEKLGARAAYERLWSSINGLDSWEANPWVWVISFKRVLNEPDTAPTSTNSPQD